jgi:integrase
VSGIPKGRRDVRQTPPVQPAAWEQLHVVVPFCTRPVMAMLLVQWWSGMRSCEVRIIRTCDIDRTNPACWLYHPAKHKNDWREGDQKRVVPLGPECQRVLSEWLRPDDPEAFLFQPRQAVAERNEKRRAQRRTPRTPSQRARRTKSRPKRAPGAPYSDTSYAHAVATACEKAGVKFHPYALRHGCKMRVERAARTEDARTVLGQRSIQATQHYGVLDVSRAAEVMVQLG